MKCPNVFCAMRDKKKGVCKFLEATDSKTFLEEKKNYVRDCEVKKKYIESIFRPCPECESSNTVMIKGGNHLCLECDNEFKVGNA